MSTVHLVRKIRKPCPDCVGTGEIVGYSHVEDGPMRVAVWGCVNCAGAGWVLA